MGFYEDLTQLSEEEWKNDFADLILIAQNVYDICGFNFTLADINFTKVGGDLGTDTIALLFGLNLLDDDEAKNNLVLAALKQFKVINEENQAKTNEKLALIKALEITIKNALELIGVTAPERM